MARTATGEMKTKTSRPHRIYRGITHYRVSPVPYIVSACGAEYHNNESVWMSPDLADVNCCDCIGIASLAAGDVD